jgi:hypothetical protein
MERFKTLDPTWIVITRGIAIGIAIGTLALGCASTPDSRIKKEQSLFDSYPVDVQSKIREGKVDLGFDESMVRLALGDPDETSTEIGESGETLSWGYTRARPGLSIGVGGGRFGGSSGVGGGVGVGSGSRKDYVAIIEFREGRVINARYFEN